MPPGLECYKSVEKRSDKCIPCKGIFLHVERDDDFKPVEELKEFKPTLERYKEYKSGFINRTEGKQFCMYSYQYHFASL